MGDATRNSVLLMVLVCLGSCADVETTLEPSIGGLSPAGTAGDEYFREFQRRLVVTSGGSISARLLTRGEIGSDEQVFSALRRGRVQLAITGSYSMATARPELTVLGMPFLFDSEQELDELVDSVLAPAIDVPLTRVGIKLLKLMPMGWINFYGAEALEAPEDLKNMRLRQPHDIASQLYARSIGADVVPLPATEIITALQTGLIDAGATVTLNYLWTGIGVHAPHLALTQHAFLFNALMANQDWWTQLSADQRAAVEQAVPPSEFFVQRMRSAECVDIATAVDDGLQVRRLTREQRARWRETALQSHPAILESLGVDAKALYAAIQQGKRAFAAGQEQPAPPSGVARCSW